jgi:hemerythrin-like domain-containing protein
LHFKGRRALGADASGNAGGDTMPQKTTQTKTSARTTARTEEAPNLYRMLKDDHDRVKELFSHVTERREQPREDLFDQIERELQTHMEAEENYFYPALEEAEDGREKVLEAYEEHHVAKTLLDELDGTDPEDETWMPKMKVLKEIVNHHIEEEEKEIFSMARKELSAGQVEEIGRQVKEAREEEL